MTTMRNRVFANLDNARENGFFDPGEQLHGATPEEIAGDLIAYAEDLANCDEEDLAAHVRDWLAHPLHGQGVEHA